MGGGNAAAGRAPLGLRVVHALVFTGFAGLALAVARTEFSQLAFAARGPWHAGTTPFWPAVLGASVAGLAALALLVRLAQRREVSLFVSGAILVGFAVSLSVSAASPAQRSVAGANVALLKAAREVQRVMGKTLQAEAEVPGELAAWQAALDAAAEREDPPGSPFRDRAFRVVALRAQLVETPDWDASGAPVGTLGVWVSGDRAEFRLIPVGLSDVGEAAVLADDRGAPIRLKGMFNPDIKR